MVQKNRPISKRVAAIMMLSHAVLTPASAQFVPGRIYTATYQNGHCKGSLDAAWVFEIDPEAGTTRVFYEFRDGCPLPESIVMSPDGKHLRVAARNWGAILEFDSDGNWEIVDLDGVFPAATWNSIVYDRRGNFYLSNYYALDEKVVKFPANGGPKQVLAYADNNGVEVFNPHSLSVGPDGEVYVADEEKIFLISPDGTVSLFDTLPDPLPGLNPFIYSILVDNDGYVHANTGTWYRYDLGDPSSREVFESCDGMDDNFCPHEGLFSSPDRSRIYAVVFDYTTLSSRLVSFDPHDGSHQTVMDSGFNGTSFAVVPLRGDIDGDEDTDLIDSEWVAACIGGSGIEASPSCDLADMDADGDVDLFDVRYFMLGYTAFHH